MQRGPQVLRARRATGAAPGADGALHHLHVPVAPFLESFVQVDQALAHLRGDRVPPVDVHEHALQFDRRLDGARRVAGEQRPRDAIAVLGQAGEEGIPERGLCVTGLESPPLRTFPWIAVDRLAALLAQHELQLAELKRLKAAAGLEAVAERQELEWRHRLEDVDLGDQHLEDREDALEGVQRARAVVGAQQLLEIVELVQHLLEPQLVHLVHDDEQSLVVLGAGTLQRQQFVEFQVTRVGDRWGGHGGESRPSPRLPASGLALPLLPLLQLRNQLLDFGFEAPEAGQHLRLQVPLQLLTFVQKILEQVADPVAQRAPGRRGFGLGGLGTFGRQGIHGVSPLKRSWMIRTPSGSGFTRSETVTPPL